MKKVLIFVMSAMMVMVSGCSELLEEDENVLLTKEAIAEGEYDDALRYGSRAIEDGYDDEEFAALMHNVECYVKAEEALDDNDLMAAKEAFSEIEDFDGSNMKRDIEDLEEDILELERESERFEDEIKEIEEDMEKEYFALALSNAKELLDDEDDDLTVEQKQRIKELIEQIENKKTPKPTPKSTPKSTPAPTQAPPRVTEQEALTMVAEKFGIHDANGDITISDQGSYFQVNVTEYIPSGDEIIEDEVSGKVDKTTGEIYDLAG